MVSSDQEVFHQKPGPDMPAGHLEISPNGGLVSDKAVVAAGLRRYLKREGLAFARQLEKCLDLMNDELLSAHTHLEASKFRATQESIDEQRRRVAETIRNILAM